MAILAILVILLAVLALVVVKALAESPWGVFTVGATIPIAMFMGCYMRFGAWARFWKPRPSASCCCCWRSGAASWFIKARRGRSVFSLHGITLAWAIIGYGLAASVLPVWLLLAPRDYLSTFMKLGTIFALALGILFVLPDLQMPALTPVHRRLGPGGRREGVSRSASSPLPAARFPAFTRSLPAARRRK